MMNAEDTAQVQDMIQKGILGAIPAFAKACKNPSAAVAVRSQAEVGSPEFAEDRTQVNSLNNKWMFEAAMNEYWARSSRSDDHYADLQSRSLDALTESLNLTKKVNSAFFEGVQDGRRSMQAWQYSTAYDLSNPVAVGTGADVTAGAVPQNRAIDESTVQTVVNSNTFQAAIQGAVADAMTGTIPTFEAAVGAAVAAALANVPNNAAGNKPTATA